MAATPRPRRSDSLLAIVGRLPPKWSSRLKRGFVRWLVPFNRALGIRVHAVDTEERQFTLLMPLRRRNTNVAGTVHGAAIMALAEAVHGVAVLWHFSPGAHRMYTKEIRMQYLKPARGTLLVTFRLESRMRRAISDALARDGACDLVLSSDVVDGRETPVARCSATYTVFRDLHGQSAKSAGRTTIREDAGEAGGERGGRAGA